MNSYMYGLVACASFVVTHTNLEPNSSTPDPIAPSEVSSTKPLSPMGYLVYVSNVTVQCMMMDDPSKFGTVTNMLGQQVGVLDPRDCKEV